MSRQRRKGPRNTIDRRDRARRNDRPAKGAGQMTQRPFKKLESTAALWQEYNDVIAERRYKAWRQGCLKAGTPKAGCEGLVVAIIARYGEEMAELTRRASMLEAKLERAGVRI